jgi:hypothetical protein
VEVAAMLEQDTLQEAVEELLNFLHAWFDFDEQGCIGIVQPGHEQLDRLKEQFMALPTLLKQVWLYAKMLKTALNRILAANMV